MRGPPLAQADIALNGGLVGAQMERVDLRGKNISGANLDNANLRGADLTDANLRGCKLTRAALSRACLLRTALREIEAVGADFSMSYMKGTNFADANIRNAVFKRVCAKNAIFFRTDMRYVDMLCGEFLGARFNDAITYGVRNVDRAIFFWWMPRGGGAPSYEARPGLHRLTHSVLHNISFQENAGRQKDDKRY